MVDPVSTVVGGAVAKSAGKKLFGPTLDAMGEDLAHLYKAWSKPRRKNVEAILAKGAKRGDGRLSDGSVNPRVAHTVVEDGSWMSDDVGQEYFAGLLLSSRSDSEDADDGVFYAGMVAGLTSNQIRLHHAIYHCFAVNCREYPKTNEERLNNAGWMPAAEVISMIQIILGDDPMSTAGEALEALNQRGLVSSAGAGTPEDFAEMDWNTSIDSCMAVVTDLGMRLFLRAYGIRTSDPNQVSNFDWTESESIGMVAPNAFLGRYDRGFQ